MIDGNLNTKDNVLWSNRIIFLSITSSLEMRTGNEMKKYEDEGLVFWYIGPMYLTPFAVRHVHRYSALRMPWFSQYLGLNLYHCHTHHDRSYRVL